MMENNSTNSVALSKYIAHFPMPLFAVIMGLSGFALTWIKSPVGLFLDGAAGGVYVAFNTIVSLIVIALYLLFLTLFVIRIFKCPGAVISDMHHPIRLNFFAGITISGLLISALISGVAQYYPTISYSIDSIGFVVWLASSLIHLLITVFTMYIWMNNERFSIENLNPSWFIPAVGNILVPIQGMHYDVFLLSAFFFGIGFLFWLVLLTLVLHRLFFVGALPPKLIPMVFILLAPPSIACISYIELNNNIDIMAIGLYSIALFTFIFLFANFKRFAKAPFFLSAWAFSFPFAAFILATTKCLQYTRQFDNGEIFTMAGVVFYTLFFINFNIMIIYLVVRTIRQLRKDAVFVPEQ